MAGAGGGEGVPRWARPPAALRRLGLPAHGRGAPDAGGRAPSTRAGGRLGGGTGPRGSDGDAGGRARPRAEPRPPLHPLAARRPSHAPPPIVSPRGLKAWPRARAGKPPERALLSHLLPPSPSSLARLAHGVERRPRLEPADLVVVERVVDREFIGGAVGFLPGERQRRARRKRFEPLDRHLVKGPHFVVVGWVGKGEREEALLLEVGLVDAGE